ncbi:MFS transporter, partial [Agromyces seonyuensis]
MSAVLDSRRALRRYLAVLALRWLPTGLIIPVTTLLMLERGLTLPEVGLVVAAQGLVVLVLELPTAGLADAIGRRPVLVAAGAFALASYALMAVADTAWLFLVVWIVQGVSRALDSGPLEAWYADAVLAEDPHAPLERGLGAGGAVLGVAIALGSLASGVLVALGPWRIGSVEIPALAVPVVAAGILEIVHLAATAVLLREARGATGARAFRTSLGGVPRAIGGALGLLRRSRVLLALVVVEVSWGFGMIAFESLTPVRLAELVGGADRAAALLGPVGAAAWGVSAAGAALAPLLGRWIGVAAGAAVLRLAQGAAVAVMGLVAGPVGLIAGFLACYLVHGASNPLHQTLLHREVDGPNRASVLSLSSMVAQPAGSLGAIVLTALAGAVSTSAAMLLGALVLALAAPLYLPARRAGRGRKSTGLKSRHLGT